MPRYADLGEFGRRFGRDVRRAARDLAGFRLEEHMSEADRVLHSKIPVLTGDLARSFRFTRDRQPVALSTGSGTAPTFESGEEAGVFSDHEAARTIDSGRHRQSTGKLANIRMVGSTQAPQGMTRPTVDELEQRRERTDQRAVKRVDSRWP